MKLKIDGREGVGEAIKGGGLEPSFKILARVGQIQRILFEQWSVLETLTPSEYLQFRGVLQHASGLQSYQYRAIEFLLGNKDANLLAPHRHVPEIHQWLKVRLEAPSIYDEFLRYLHRKGHPIPPPTQDPAWPQPYEHTVPVA